MRIITPIFAIAILFLIGFSSCGQPESPSKLKENDYVHFYDDSIFRQVEKIVPKNWMVINDSAYKLVLRSKDYIQICNFTNAEDYSGNDYASYIKDKIIAKQFFEIRFTFRKKLTDEQIITINARNEWVDKQVAGLYKKFGFQRAQLENDFHWHNKVDSLQIVSFKNAKADLEKQRISVPDFSTKTKDVYVSNNLPFPNSALCLPNQEKEVEDLIYKVEGILIGEK